MRFCEDDEVTCLIDLFVILIYSVELINPLSVTFLNGTLRSRSTGDSTLLPWAIYTYTTCSIGFMALTTDVIDYFNDSPLVTGISILLLESSM